MFVNGIKKLGLCIISRNQPCHNPHHDGIFFLSHIHVITCTSIILVSCLWMLMFSMSPGHLVNLLNFIWMPNESSMYKPPLKILMLIRGKREWESSISKVCAHIYLIAATTGTENLQNQNNQTLVKSLINKINLFYTVHEISLIIIYYYEQNY